MAAAMAARVSGSVLAADADVGFFGRALASVVLVARWVLDLDLDLLFVLALGAG